MLNLTVNQFMTASPYTIGHDQPLSAAHRLMREHDIRHLPVLDGGGLVGILSQRDLHLIETLKDVDPDQVRVSEAMSTEVLTVRPRASVRRTVTEMTKRKIGSAVVIEGMTVVGVFTTTDAMGVLVGMLEPAVRREVAARAASAAER